MTTRQASSTTARPPTTATTSITSTTAVAPPPTSGPAAPPESAPEVGTGAVWDLDFPDPFVLSTPGAHYAYATASGVIQIQRLDGDVPDDWAGPFEVLSESPSWANDYSTWAPALLATDGGYLLYYTAQVAGTDQHCISYAEGPAPDGPFVDASTEPWLCPADLGGAIDPSPFVDVDGSLWLLWKNDGVTLRRESAIWSQRLTPDGRSLDGEPIRLIQTDQDWEFPHVEAPSMTRVGDTYWLAYSANWWNQPAYGVGFARCASPAGPCEKPFDGPLLVSTAGAEGPGGAEFFVDRWGRLLLAYHAWTDAPGYPGNRALFFTVPDLPD